MSEPTRTCTKCGIEQPLKSGFYWKSATRHRPGRHTSQCRQCLRAYINARTAECRAYVARYKLERGCMDCGLMTDRPEVYDLDHRPGEVKVAKLSIVYQSGILADTIAEVAKCDVVCANCHRVRTFDRMKEDIIHSAKEWDVRALAEDPRQPSLFDLPAE